MYDYLVKRLRDWPRVHVQYDGSVDQLHDEAANAIEELSAKVASLQFFADSILKLPDCNTCLKKTMCEFMPKLGEYCRINCPAWLGEPEPPKEDKHE